MSNELARNIADRIVKDVAELSDRTSPDDWPEAMLVTAEELILICERNIILALNDQTGTQTDNSGTETCA